MKKTTKNQEGKENEKMTKFLQNKKRENKKNKYTARDDTSSSSAAAPRDGGNPSLLSALVGVTVFVKIPREFPFANGTIQTLDRMLRSRRASKGKVPVMILDPRAEILFTAPMETCPVPLKHNNVVRQTETLVHNVSECTISEIWTEDGDVSLVNSIKDFLSEIE